MTVWATDEVLKLVTVAAASEIVTKVVLVAYEVTAEVTVAGFRVVCTPAELVLVTTSISVLPGCPIDVVLT